MLKTNGLVGKELQKWRKKNRERAFAEMERCYKYLPPLSLEEEQAAKEYLRQLVNGVVDNF